MYDMNADYRMNSRLTLTGYLGWVEGLAAIEAIYPNGKNSRFAYLEALISF